MSDNELAAFIALLLTSSATIIFVARFWLGRGDKKHQLPPQHAASEERLTRIEQAVDAIAVEVERISEGQRFVTKVLADRNGEAAALPAAAREGLRPGVRP